MPSGGNGSEPSGGGWGKPGGRSSGGKPAGGFFRGTGGLGMVCAGVVCVDVGMVCVEAAKDVGMVTGTGGLGADDEASEDVGMVCVVVLQLSACRRRQAKRSAKPGEDLGPGDEDVGRGGPDEHKAVAVPAVAVALALAVAQISFGSGGGRGPCPCNGGSLPLGASTSTGVEALLCSSSMLLGGTIGGDVGRFSSWEAVAAESASFAPRAAGREPERGCHGHGNDNGTLGEVAADTRTTSSFWGVMLFLRTLIARRGGTGTGIGARGIVVGRVNGAAIVVKNRPIQLLRLRHGP